MNKMMKLVFLGLCLFITAAQAEIIWVGDSSACDAQSTSEETLTLALLVSALNSDTSDEIRLTNAGTNYTGNAGHYTINDWSGILTIKGGYSDCGVATSSRPIMGNWADPVFTINNSTVLLTNLTLSQSGSRALLLDNYATAVLDNVMIYNNQSGIEVKDNSYVNIKANSVVQLNNDFGVAKGGGIYCHGTNSGFLLSGKVHGNSAVKGGNIFAETGCFAELGQKSAVTNGHASDAGGGLLIDNGGELWAQGGAELVIIQGNIATNGGGIFVWGSGKVTLLNTFMNNNTATDKGAAIFAANGGPTAIQVSMDRVDDCPFLISCSMIKGHDYNQSLVYVYYSNIDMSRTIVDQNNYIGPYEVHSSLFFAINNSRVRLNRVAITRNEAWYLLTNEADSSISRTFATHMTVARNQFHHPSAGELGSFVWKNRGTMDVENSIFTDTHGADDRWADNIGKCNLVDDGTGWGAGTYVVGTPQFINVDGGDMRQVAGSPGVDMCQQDNFGWSTEKDLENQWAPVNENTNPQGQPGQTGGLFDAGVDEVYDNIGEDMFLLTVQKTGAGSGGVVSTPLGISCGTDCTEVYFNGTVVTLYAIPSSGSEFMGWQGCPLVNGDGNCMTSVNSSHTIYANFQPDDLIFENGFE